MTVITKPLSQEKKDEKVIFVYWFLYWNKTSNSNIIFRSNYLSLLNIKTKINFIFLAWKGGCQHQWKPNQSYFGRFCYTELGYKKCLRWNIRPYSRQQKNISNKKFYISNLIRYKNMPAHSSPVLYHHGLQHCITWTLDGKHNFF